MERLRGLNFGGWLSQIDAIKEKDPEKFPGIDVHMDTFIGEEDFKRQKDWGFNHVRIPVDFYLFFDEFEKPFEHRFKSIDNAVKWTEKSGLFLIIDLHECPGHDFADATDIPVQRIFEDPGYIKKTQRIWAYLSERYGDHKHVLFEVLNEPVAPTAQVWNSVKDQLCKTIRSHAPSSTIVVGSNMWNWPSTYKDFTPFESDNVMYCFHFYEPLLFTHQFAPWMKEPEVRVRRAYPGDYGSGFARKYDLVQSDGVWNRERFIKDITPVAEFGERYKVPLICDEFGVYAPVPMEYQKLWLNDLLSVLKDMNIGYCYWNYKNLDFGIISQGEKLHEQLPQYDNPERINYQILSILQAH
ncbi:MAG: glycoside hydrolase family 5 protein [Fibrobacter sp.]|nr:glycoside hydrolase family 5 protein [Fibrobacter sp.]